MHANTCQKAQKITNKTMSYGKVLKRHNLEKTKHFTKIEIFPTKFLIKNLFPRMLSQRENGEEFKLLGDKEKNRNFSSNFFPRSSRG
jgi:hypothetical protein